MSKVYDCLTQYNDQPLFITNVSDVIRIAYETVATAAILKRTIVSRETLMEILTVEDHLLNEGRLDRVKLSRIGEEGSNL